jgi:hypothetical protein
MLCTQCHHECHSRFEVTVYSSTNKVLVVGQLCSVACLVRWALLYGWRVGQRGLQTLLKAVPKLPLKKPPGGLR